VHKAEQSLLWRKCESIDADDERFEDCIIDYQANPFGRGEGTQSRQYIDDMTSSSGMLSGYSENADCFPVVEQVD